MKKVVAILMAALMLLSCTAALAENIKLDKLTFEFVRRSGHHRRHQL